MSVTATLTNHSPFEARLLPMPDGEGGEASLLVVKASFDLGPEGPLLSPEPAALRMADAFRGDPKLGYPGGDSDLALVKPKVDVLIVDACAHAPGGRPARQLFAELHVGYPGGPASDVAAHDQTQAQLIKSLLVSGDRVWIDDQPSEALPFVSMPIEWTRSFGGRLSETELDEQNPLGVGWRGASSSDPELSSELPNIEDPGAPMVNPTSACPAVGFGPVARAWLPRRALAGTFDIAWRRRRWPLWPRDHDPAYAQSAAADQQIARYVGGEPVRLVNLTPEGEWLFRLPGLDLPVHLFFRERHAQAELRVDTVEIETVARRVHLTARVSVPVSRGPDALVEVVLGHAKPGWVRARATGKCYLDLRDEGGFDPQRPCFW